MDKCRECGKIGNHPGDLCFYCKERRKRIAAETQARETQAREAEAAERQRLAETESRERREAAELQERLHQEQHLNGLKRMLLDQAIRGVSEPDAAIARLAVIMRSRDFAENLDWFWDDVSANPLLLKAYFSQALAPLTAGSNDSDEVAIGLFDRLDEAPSELLGKWLAEQPMGSTWRTVVLPKFDRYVQVLEARAREKAREEEAQRAAAEREKEKAKRKWEEGQAEREAAEAAASKQRAADQARLEAEQSRRDLSLHGAEFGYTMTFVAGASAAGMLRFPAWWEMSNVQGFSVFAMTLLVFVGAVYPLTQRLVRKAGFAKSWGGLWLGWFAVVPVWVVASRFSDSAWVIGVAGGVALIVMKSARFARLGAALFVLGSMAGFVGLAVAAVASWFAG